MEISALKESTKKLNILYVEDSLTARNIGLKILYNFFENIDVAVDGKEAFTLYKEYYNNNGKFYDIVFSDLEMPIMGGEELSHLILDFNIEQELVIISGVQDFNTVVKLINLGLKKFIPKPMEPAALTEILIDIVNNIRKKKASELDKEELEEYNRILKDREEENKKLLEIKVKELDEFNYALEVSAIVAKTDLKGVITYVNKKFCDISGYSGHELLGQKMSIIKSDLRTSSYYKKIWNKIINREIYNGLFENKNKEGNFYYIETTISPIVDKNDEILEFIAVSHDMTQLMNSLSAQKEAEKSKQEFFINISHEMRTPLNSILSFSSLLPKHLKGNEKALKMVDVIAQTGDDLKNLVESIIDVNNLKSDKILIQKSVFNTNEELMKCFDMYKRKADENGVAYKINIDPYVPFTLLGDINRITQVVGILIDNAIKFTASQTPKVLINVLYDKENQILICEVKDNGIGIDKLNQEKIFEIKQLDASLNRSHEGAGLGLHIASELVKLMQGKILLKSIPNKGSLFSVEFPLEEN
ncbi:PAS domain S-box protein [Sulfurimonas sp. SAG-AH-194-C20]|nr:ATP-binding protein [Sulfurimonas sp. SAG-AH-194-C20]MDF1878818.1 PAS domain S-box protein [Sulfurimonas sp. SAG-AH-194-C20]